MIAEVRKEDRMYKCGGMFCRLRVGLYNINCIQSRTFGVISHTSIDRNRNYGHGFGFSHIRQNFTSTRALHMLAKSPTFLNNNKNLPDLKPQIRHVNGLEKSVDALSNNAVVKGFEECLLYLHNVTGLPWWIDIVLSAFLINLTIKLPLRIFAIKQQEKLLEVREKLMLSYSKVSMMHKKEALKNKLDRKEKIELWNKSYSDKRDELFMKYNCHPVKVYLAEMSPIIIFMVGSFALRNLSGNSVGSLFSEMVPRSPELMTEGILWFSNLTNPDPYYVLPVLLTLQRLRTDQVLRKTNPQLKKFMPLMTFLCLVFMFISTYFPSSIILFWISNGVFSSIIRHRFKLPQVKKF